MKLDKKDKKILEVLHDNARASVADISRKTGIQRDSVMYRLQRMQKEKSIRFFHTVLDPTVLGHPIYSFVNLSLHNLSDKKEKSLISFLKAHPNVVYVAKTTGKWDLVLNVAAKDLKHFDGILTEIRTKFPELVNDYDTASIIEEYKYDYMVELISG